VWGSMREWTLTLPRQLPLWEVESRWSPEPSESNCRGQTSMACGVLYINGKLLKRRCLKWARIAHLDIWNTSYGQKKGRESNCQFDSRPQKVRNRPLPDVRFGSATRRWKALDKSYNFALDRIAIGGLLAKLWGSKVPRVPFGAISGLPFGSPGKNSHLDVASMESCRVYYKGEGGGFSQVRAVVSLVCPCCSWLVLAPRVLLLCTNHFVWVVCRPVWVTKVCQLFLVPSRSSNSHPLPLKGLWARGRAPTPPYSAAFYLGSHLSPLRSWECVTDHLLPCTPCISSFPLKLMKMKSAATHQWRRPDYPDQRVCVHTNCTLMESLSCHLLFGYTIIHLSHLDFLKIQWHELITPKCGIHDFDILWLRPHLSHVRHGFYDY